MAQSALSQTPPPERLTLQDAIRIAQLRNPLVSAGTARISGADARLKGAGALPNPTLLLAQPFGNNTGGLDEGIVLTETVELGDKRRQRVRASRGERDALRFDFTGTQTDLALSAQTAYFEALRSDVEKQLAENVLSNAQAFNKAAQLQFQAGDVAQRDVIRSQIELSRAEQTLTVAETERANRYANLRSLLLFPAETPLILTDLLTFSPGFYSLPTLLKTALKARPDLQSACKIREAREAALHSARAQSQPDLFLEARRSTLDPTAGGNSVRVGVIFPLFDAGRIKADTNSARAALREQEATFEEATRVARLDVEDRKSTRLNSSHSTLSRMPSSA